MLWTVCLLVLVHGLECADQFVDTSAGSDTAIGRWGQNCDVNIHNVFTVFRQIFLNNSATIGLVIGALSILALTRGFQVIQIYISTYLLELRTICIYNIIDQMIFLRLISNCSYPMQCHFCICNPWGAGEVASLASAAATAGPLTAHPPPMDTGTPPPPEYGQWQGSDQVMLSTLLDEKFEVEEGSYEGHKLPWDYQLEQLFHFSLCGGVEVKKKVSKHLSVLNHWFICQCEK